MSYLYSYSTLIDCDLFYAIMWLIFYKDEILKKPLRTKILNNLMGIQKATNDHVPSICSEHRSME